MSDVEKESLTPVIRMTPRFVIFLLLASVIVGAAIVYVTQREPTRVTNATKLPCPPDAKDCLPGTRSEPPAKPVPTPRKSEDF